MTIVPASLRNTYLVTLLIFIFINKKTVLKCFQFIENLVGRLLYMYMQRNSTRQEFSSPMSYMYVYLLPTGLTWPEAQQQGWGKGEAGDFN